jgi:hypothetical protein
LSIIPSESGDVKVTWGPYPMRSTGTFSLRHYASKDSSLRRPVSSSEASGVSFSDSLGEPGKANGYYRFTGTITPKYSEKYTFVHEGDSCKSTLKINGSKIMKPCKGYMQASIELKAGKDYEIDLVTAYGDDNSPHSEYLYWFSKSQPFGIVPPKPDGSGEKTVPLKKGEKARIPLPSLKEDDGVKLEMASDGITLSYPQWDYDVRGVVYGNGNVR